MNLYFYTRNNKTFYAVKHFTKHYIKSFGIFLFFILLAPSCVTEKKNTEPKGFALFMKNLTARYNGYFNANVLFKEANVKLEAQHIDNFSKILAVYPEADVENPKSVAPDLDKAIEKIAVVATYHRSSDWVDDCYLLLGKAQYLKHEYDNAQETFEYLTEVYNPAMKGKIGKRTKKQIEQAHKETQKEREALLKERAKEKQTALKEKQQIQKEKVKDREDAAKQRKRELEERIKQRERDNKERARLRKLGIKPPPRDTSTQNSLPKVTKPGVVRSGTNGTPVYKDVTSKDVVKKKDKNPKRPDRYFLKHRPCYQEGVVWLARTYTERQDYDDADLLLAQLEKSPKTFKDIRASAAVARAEFYLKQNNFEKAIPSLENAIALCKKKKQKPRLIFILAQVLQNIGENKKAFALFDKALNYTLPYDMEFNARLNKALTSDDASVDKTTATLIGMSKDYKNKEFNDQIYYTLGQIAVKNNQKDKAVGYLKQSLASSGRNPLIKADAYFTLAKLQFDAEEYASSKKYFDSSLTVLPKIDDRRVEADKMSLNLVDIAHNYEVVMLQDSLLRIAALSDKEKKEWAKRMYKKKRTEAIAKDNASTAANKAAFVDPSLQLPNQVKSNFWAYNQDIIKKGKKEFEKKWGDRRLEDNWRRSSKKTSTAGNDAKTGTESADESLDKILDSDYAEFLKDIPKTSEQITAAKEKMDEAMFGLGAGYHDRLQNYKKSTATLEQHLSRFPTSRHEPEDYYYLYQNYTSLSNAPAAQKNYDALLAKYPGTPFANSLKDNKTPGKIAEKSIDKYYNTTYALFKKGSYDTVAKRVKESPAIFGSSNIYAGKFALLDAFCAGRLSGRDAYIAGLKNVIAKYAGSPEEKRAKETLHILESGASPEAKRDSVSKDENEDVAKFKPDNDKLHYVLVVLPKDADLENIKVKISDFNGKYHRLDDLKISSVFLSTEPEIPMVVVRKFKDKRAALVFTDNVKSNTKEFMGDIKAEVFAATQDNYREILRQKTIDNYKIFYQKNY